jgi:hypothetical protein
MNPRTQQLLDRVPDHPAAAPVRKAMIDCLTIADGFRAQSERLAKDENLTPQGRRNALAEALKKGFARDLRDARKPLDGIKSQIDQLRARTKSRAANPGDIAGILERQEIRAIIRAMPLSDRSAMILNSTDPRIVEAVLQMPPAMSGLPADLYAAIEKKYTEEKFAPELSKIAELEDLVAHANAAHDVARGDLRQTMGLDAQSFDQVMKPIEQRLNAPWLKRDGDTVRVITPSANTAREATEDEIRDGVFYPDYAAYREARAPVA